MIEANGTEKTVITSIRATDVALGLRRIPAGFYTIVYHSGLEWRTENKRVCVNNDVVEWDDPIPVPPDPLVSVSLEIYASFELQPLLGRGEQLRKLTLTAQQLLGCNGEDLVINFLPEDGDVISPCSSLIVTVGEREYRGNGVSASNISDAHSSAPELQDQLGNATDRGHGLLTRYQKHGEEQDLERSIEQFNHALSACPLDHPCRAVVQFNIATAKFIHAQVNDSHNDDPSFDTSLTSYRDALAARPVGHPDRASTLIQLAAVHFARFEKWKDEADATQAKALLDEAKSVTSQESHENRAAAFMLQLFAGRKTGDVQAGPQSQSSTNPDSTSLSTDENTLAFGMQSFDRFERSGALDDLQRAISSLEAYLLSATKRDGKYLLALANVGVALSSRFNCLGDLDDLDQAISRYKEAVSLVLDGHPQKPGWLANLGNSFLSRFEQLQELGDLEQAISNLEHAVSLIPDDHPHKAFHLSNLGNCFLTRFECLGKPDDLDQVISKFKDALKLAPDGHPHRPVLVNNLGNAFKARFERFGEPGDLEQAVSRYGDAISLTPDDSPHKPGILSSLGNSLFIRFDRFGKLSDLQQAILRNEDAILLTPDGHPAKPGRLHALGNCLKARFDHIGQLSDLEQAISMFLDAVELTPDGLACKHMYLNGLGSAYLTRFERLGDLGDLEQATSRCRDAVNLIPDGHPHKPGYLHDLGASLINRFKRFGEFDDLEEAILRGGDAVDLTPDGHIEKPGRLQALGNFLTTRFERLGDLSDLEQALSKHEEAVSLTPSDHPERASRLNCLGSSLNAQFEHFGDLSVLERAISTFRDVVDLTPDDHAAKPIYLNNLGAFLLSRFERLGELADLEQGISILKEVSRLIPDGHFKKPACLHNLGIALQARFDRLEEPSDLDQAVLRLVEAVELIPVGDAQKPGFLNSLGNSLVARFELSGDISDLEQAILRHGEAVDLVPDGHPNKPSYLANHGGSLRIRFGRLGELDDLVQAISRHEDAVSLTPDGHQEKPSRLNSLGNSLKDRFDRLGELADLEQAISRYRDAVDLTPHEHVLKPGRLRNFGTALFIRFERLQQPDDCEEAILAFSRAACAFTGSTTERFLASGHWIVCARTLGHHTLLDAYSCLLGLLPSVAWIGFPLEHRYRELLRGAGAVQEAAAAALDSGRVQTAVEWLEQGRSVVWGGLFQLRSSYGELESVHPDRAHKLRQLSAALEDAGATREKSLSEHVYTVQHGADTLEQQVDKHRGLAIERDRLLEEIRRLPGFKSFLLHKEYSQLRASAHSGPVVILNAAEHRCDALIVLADKDDAVHVPFPNFTLKRLEGFQTALKNIVFSREGKPMRLDNTKKWKVILSILWNFIVKPVLDALNISTPGDLSRIFWCPTGPFAFLPIHAAGLYDEAHSSPGHKLSDFVVSSYVPTLSILAPLAIQDPAPSSGGLRFLAVRQPSTDGLRPLPGVDGEMRYIEAIIQNAPSSQVTLVESSVGTVEEVLELMKDADWVHFACHGTQDDDRPIDSGLCLADGRRLKLSDMLGLSRPRGGLAFLSACETAMGDKSLSDEAIHIAAGMLFAGYGSVIATMWSISDRLAPGLAKFVYEQLFRDGKRPDVREAARAMQDAAGCLRDGGALFEEWLPFIHVGL